MQNVVNYLCPFFRNGTPIVNGRVYFVKPDTTAQTFTDIVELEGADFIAIKDKNGTLLENPLSLNSEGRFSVQPFVDDGTDFKMIVCYPTGVPAEINDESMTYDVAYTINSFVLPLPKKSTYKTYFLNIPLFMRVRKRFDAEKIRRIG